MKKTARVFAFLVCLLCASLAVAEDIVLESDVLRLVLHDQSGSYSLYRKNGEKGKFTAYTDISDDSSSSFFAIKAGSAYIPLRRNYKLNLETVRNEDGSASFLWTIGKTLQAEIRFTLLAAEQGSAADSVRVDLSVMNLIEDEGMFSMKAVIDTVLGETSRIHFTTAKGSAVGSEKAFPSMIQDKWISSSNGIGTLSVLLAGASTAPEYVLAANRDLLLSDVWKPVVNESRSFSSLLSPNNSALGIWFPEKKLKLYETARFTFFITTAADGNIPPVAALLGIEPEQQAVQFSESTVASASQIVNDAVNAEGYMPASSTRQKKTVDKAYIQQLLDHIQVIEESDNPDEAEIKKLSAEIDALILELTK